MFYITESDYGSRHIVDTLHTVEDALDAIDAMEAAIDDGAPSYRLRYAIAELKDQLEPYI